MRTEVFPHLQVTLDGYGWTELFLMSEADLDSLELEGQSAVDTVLAASLDQSGAAAASAESEQVRLVAEMRECNARQLFAVRDACDRRMARAVTRAEEREAALQEEVRALRAALDDAAPKAASLDTIRELLGRIAPPTMRRKWGRVLGLSH